MFVYAWQNRIAASDYNDPALHNPTLSWSLPPMKHVNEARLESDLAYRYGYLAEFIGFGAQDVQAVHAAGAADGLDGLPFGVFDGRHFGPGPAAGNGNCHPAGLQQAALDSERLDQSALPSA